MRIKLLNLFLIFFSLNVSAQSEPTANDNSTWLDVISAFDNLGARSLQTKNFTQMSDGIITTYQIFNFKGSDIVESLDPSCEFSVINTENQLVKIREVGADCRTLLRKLRQARGIDPRRSIIDLKYFGCTFYIGDGLQRCEMSLPVYRK